MRLSQKVRARDLEEFFSSVGPVKWMIKQEDQKPSSGEWIGEIFILDDGGLVDKDMGDFERFLDVNLPSMNNITIGKIYEHVIMKEKNDEYNGETVLTIPHVTSAIQDWIEKAAMIPVMRNMHHPEVCIIELGGVIGDIDVMPFVEAFRQFQVKVRRENFCCVHVTWVPQPSTAAEHKTKPTLLSVQELKKRGLTPDVIICRSENDISYDFKKRVSQFSQVPTEQIINIKDLPSVYHIPVTLKANGLSEFLCNRLHLIVPSPRPRRLMTKWRELASRFDNLKESVCVALIGKYTKLDTSYMSLRRALWHAALACDRNLVIQCIYAEDLEQDRKEKDPVTFHKAWEQLCKADAIIVPSGKGPRGIEGKIAAIQWTRTFKKPFLGIGLGFHCAVIEYARNVLKWNDAHTAEVNKSSTRNVVIELTDNMSHKKKNSVTNIGKKTSVFKQKKSVTQLLYGSKSEIEERHSTSYIVNPKYVTDLEKAGMNFIAHDPSSQRMDVLEMNDLPFFVAVQFQPEYLSRPLKPSPPLLGLILAARKKLDEYLRRNFMLSPCYGSDVDCSDDETLSIGAFPEGDCRNTSQSSFVTTDAVDDDDINMYHIARD